MLRIPPVTINDGRGANQPAPVPPNTPRPEEHREQLFDEDVFLAPTQADRVPLIPRPALEMASSVDTRLLQEMTKASQFENWLLSQVVVWKTYLNDPNADQDRKPEFFSNARNALVLTSLNPQERARALESFRKAENELDR